MASEPPMSPPEDQPGGIFAYRLDSMEKHMAAIEVMLADFRRHVDERFERTDGRIGTLEFVRKDVYDVRHEELRSMLREEIEARKLADEANHSLAMWSLGSLITVIGLVSILLGVIKVFVS